MDRRHDSSGSGLPATGMFQAHANGKEAMAKLGAQPEPSRSVTERSAIDASAASSAVDLASVALTSRFARLWQFPLLLLSFSLFGYAGYRLIDPQPAPTIDQRLDSAGALLAKDQADAATEILRALLLEDEKKILTETQRGRVNLYLASAVQQVQHGRKLDLPVNHQRIIEYTQAAERNGVALDAAALRRVAESYEALGKSAEALAWYRRAMDADVAGAPLLRRKIIHLHVAQNQSPEAEALIKVHLEDPRVTQAERSWAIGEQSRLLVDRMMFAQARDLLLEAIRTEQDPALLGQFHYRLGYSQWKLGDDKSAERYLRLARNQLQVANPHDAEAALLLGKILLGQKQFGEAISFFNAVLVSHPDSPAAIPARLYRGVARIESGADSADGGMQDVTQGVAEINARASRFIHKPDAIKALMQASAVMIHREQFEVALELLAMEQSLEPTATPDFFARLSRVYERRAAQLKLALQTEPEGNARVKKWQQWRDTAARAADAAMAQARGLTVDDDAGYGEALWRSIELYDRAGSLPQVISSLELFITERPNDPLAPDALLRLGKAYHAAGQFDKAISAFKRNQFRYEQTLAAQKSGVPLAKAYIAKGSPSYRDAEDALHATLQSPLLTPDADEFRQALLELAELYYRTGRFEEACAKLEEITQRYPNDERMGRLQFLMADSYRKSAGLLAPDVGAKPATRPTTLPSPQDAALRTEQAAARRDRLVRARQLYDAALEQYRASPPTTEMDQLYLKLSHFYRADCAYDIGDYEEAIRLYDAAALRFQDDPSALTAYVQIVNAYAALNRPGEARSANERARWLLQRMPAAAFEEAHRSMPQSAWNNWVKWTKAANATAGVKNEP